MRSFTVNNNLTPKISNPNLCHWFDLKLRLNSITLNTSEKAIVHADYTVQVIHVVTKTQCSMIHTYMYTYCKISNTGASAIQVNPGHIVILPFTLREPLGFEIILMWHLNYSLELVLSFTCVCWLWKKWCLWPTSSLVLALNTFWLLSSSLWNKGQQLENLWWELRRSCVVINFPSKYRSNTSL